MNLSGLLWVIWMYAHSHRPLVGVLNCDANFLINDNKLLSILFFHVSCCHCWTDDFGRPWKLKEQSQTAQSVTRSFIFKVLHRFVKIKIFVTFAVKPFVVYWWFVKADRKDLFNVESLYIFMHFIRSGCFYFHKLFCL